jgi:hypothetical protein
MASNPRSLRTSDVVPSVIISIYKYTTKNVNDEYANLPHFFLLFQIYFDRISVVFHKSESKICFNFTIRRNKSKITNEY